MLVRWLLLLLFFGLQAAGAAQAIHFGRSEDVLPMDEAAFDGEVVAVPGQGRAIHGFSLLERGSRHTIGDPPEAALRSFIDTAWSHLDRSADSAVAGEGVHWVRMTLQPNDDMNGRSVLLSIAAHYPYQVFLNGAPLTAQVQPVMQVHDSLVLPLQRSFIFLVDGAPEVLALRVAGPLGASFRQLGVHFSIHAAEVHYSTQRNMVHYGVFIGINGIIVLLALVMGRGDAQRGSWVLLALLALLGVLGIVTTVGGEEAMLGFSPLVARVLRVLGALLVAWPEYLLLLVLGTLGRGLSSRQKRRYTVAVICFSVIMAFYFLGELMGWLDTGNGLVIKDGRWQFMVSGLVLILIFTVIITWFFVDVVRLGIRLFRSRGNARWIGAGAVASGLFALVLRGIGAATGNQAQAWLGLVADYCTYVAVPVSIALYMAIRSAEHNRLVARQRDELDEEVKERTAELRAEKQRSDDLLRNILPEEVAEELKHKGAAEAVHFDQVTVLFTDFKGFTAMSEVLSPRELVKDLNECFSAFDRITGKYGIEKIKTIGDAYMAAGGLPTPNATHAQDVVNAALEIRDFIAEGKARKIAAGLPYFEIRIGVHTGPVVAGIVGVKKFQYDIWGDTVNTASRLESSGDVGKVNISEATYASVKDGPDLRFTPRGRVEAKGKGEMEMFYVERKNTAAL